MNALGWEEIGSYIYAYNHKRLISPYGIYPAHIHEVNNNTKILEELERLKQNTRLERKRYWEQKQFTDLDTEDDLQNYGILSK